MNDFETLTPAQKAAITRRKNAEKRKAKRDRELAEMEVARIALMAILENPEATSAEHLRAAETLVKLMEATL